MVGYSEIEINVISKAFPGICVMGSTLPASVKGGRGSKVDMTFWEEKFFSKIALEQQAVNGFRISITF